MPEGSRERRPEERREVPRPAWLTVLAGFVTRRGVWPAVALASGASVVGSTVFCHLLYWLFDFAPTGFALVLPTLAPAVVAPLMIYALVRAIDLQGRTEAALRAQRERLDAALKAAQEQAMNADEAARTKTQFLAHMSHELRTPLNAILGFSETIRDQLLGPVGTEAYARYAADIHASGGHLLSLIDDILDMSRVEAGRVDLQRDHHDVSPLVEECLAIVRPEAEAKRHAVSGPEAADGLKVFGDRRAVKQVLINLLSNAVKFTPPDGRVVISAAGTVGGGVRFVVADTGAGIDEADLARIFEPFVRLEHAEAGTGLGLPLAKGLVELHGGALRIDSMPGRGTEVIVDLPGEREQSGVA